MGKSRYKVQFGGLPVGLHEFEFELDQTFFNNTEEAEIERAKLEVKVLLTKQNNLLQATVNIEGTVGIACDRCLKDFDFPTIARSRISFSFGHSNPLPQTWTLFWTKVFEESPTQVGPGKSLPNAT